MQGEILARLRAATGASHQRLEGRLDILSRVERPAARRALTARFYGLHAGLEGALSPWLAGVSDLDFDQRRRTAWLERDLAADGVNAAALATCPAPAIPDLAYALGLAYVLEGSTLGGRAIRRHLAGQGCDMSGLSFLDPYGEATGARWRAFLAVLERDAATAPGNAEAGAIDGFALTEDWLCEPAAAIA